MTHIRRPSRKRPSPKKHKIANISKTVHRTRKVSQHFRAARREESNGLCFRSIRQVVFELWSKMWIWPLTSGELLDRKWNFKTRNMGGKSFTSCTFWSLEWIGPVVFKIWLVKVFYLLTSGDLDLWPWPLKNNRELKLAKIHLVCTFGELMWNPFCVIVRTSFG